jgi:hypothetical protein
MGPAPWSARALASVFAVLRKQQFTGPGTTDVQTIARLVGNLHAYYTKFAFSVFPCTQRCVATYVAVMIDALCSGIVDRFGLVLVRRCGLIGALAPALIDYPKLDKFITCKAMSTGLFALRTASATPRGVARQCAVYPDDPLLV